jgi:hypothetical protein
MAIVELPFFAYVKGTFANAIFYEMNGKKVMKSKPFNPKNPNSPKQQLVRTRFKVTVILMAQFIAVLNDAYGSSKRRNKPYYHISGLNLKNAFVPETAEIDPARFVFCDHDGPRPDSFVLSIPFSDAVRIEYKAYPRNDEEGGLEMFFMVLNTNQNKIWKCPTVCSYNAGTVDLALPGQSGETLHLYSCTQDNVNLFNELPRKIFTFCGTITILQPFKK